MPAKSKYKIKISVLPGEPLDGSGKACIHLFVADPKGSFVEPHVLHPGENGQIVARPTRGRIACNNKLIPSSKPDRNNVITVTQRVDDPRAVSCPKCKATEDYKSRIRKLQES